MNKSFPVLLLLLVVLAPLAGARGQEQEQKQEQEQEHDDILRIRSNGLTRIEIHQGNQVAVYTGGVQFEYQDYRLSADRLRYDQAESYAEATGDVLLEQDGSRLATQRVEIYIDENLLRCPGELTGGLSAEGLAFRAASAEVKISGSPMAEGSAYEIALRDSVEIQTSAGYRFHTERVSLDTGSRLLNVPGRFTLSMPGPASGAGGARPLLLQDLLLTGSSMYGTLDEDMQLKSLHAVATEVRGEQLQFIAGSVTTTFIDNGHGGTMIDLLATGSPVTGLMRQPGQDLSFSADTISGTIDPGWGSQFLLSGGIDLSADLALLKSEELSIVQDMQGVRIVFPEGLEAGMALDVMSGNEDVDLSTILHK